MSNNPDSPKPHDRPALVHAVKTMPGWKLKLLAVGLLVGCAGVAGQIVTNYRKGPAPVTPVVQKTTVTTVTPSSGVAPSGSSGFVGGQPSYTTAPPTVQTTTTTQQPAPAVPPTIMDAVTPFMSHFGFSLFVGIMVGLIFRTFLRVALLFSALIIGGAMALSYFGHINIDLGSVKTDTSQAVNWLTDQGYRLKGMLFQALPSSTAAGIGFLLGFKKR